MTTTVLSFRDLLRMVCPLWLQEGENEKYLYAECGLWADYLGTALNAGVVARFPGFNEGATSEIGRERKIRRGSQEDATAYAYRIRGWLDYHRTRGGPYSLLQQLHAFWSRPDPTSSTGYRQYLPFEIIYRNGRRFTMPVQEYDPFRDPTDAPNILVDDIDFDPDSQPEKWAQYWLYIRTDEFGPVISASTRADLRLVPRDFQPAHALGFVVVLPSTSETIDTLGSGPGGTLGGPINKPGTINTPVATTVIEVAG